MPTNPQLPPRPKNADDDPEIVERENYLRTLLATIKEARRVLKITQDKVDDFNEYMKTERAKLEADRKQLERDKLGDPTRPRVPRSNAIHNPLS